MKYNEMKPNNADRKNSEMHLRIIEIKTLKKIEDAFSNCSATQKNENERNTFESPIQKTH